MPVHAGQVLSVRDTLSLACLVIVEIESHCDLAGLELVLYQAGLELTMACQSLPPECWD